MIDNTSLLNLCSIVYNSHEQYGNAFLDNAQITELRTLLQTDTGNFNLSFPAPYTLVIYNDYFLIEYVHLPEPTVEAFEDPVKISEKRIKYARERELSRQRERFKAVKEKREKEVKRQEMQSRILDKMGVRLKVQKNIPLEEVKKETVFKNTDKSKGKINIRNILKSKIFILISLSIILGGFILFMKYSTREKVKNDLTSANIKGRVKTIKISTYPIVKRFGDIEKGDLKNKRIFQYTDRGNIEKCNVYDAVGSLVTNVTYKYNNEGNLEEVISANKTFSLRYTYKHDSSGNRILQNIYDTDGSLFMYHTTIYNDDGNQIKTYSYNADNTLYMVHFYNYNSYGHMLDKISNEPNGSLSYKSVYMYDDRENLIEEYSYNSAGNLNIKSTYKYEGYDKKGNWLKRIEFKNDNAIEITEREIEFY